jgi:hypothetical protein
MLDENFVPDGGQPDQSNNFFSSGQPGGQAIHQHQFGMTLVNSSLTTPHPGAGGQRYYTIQRVNGNGGNGKGDGVPGPHKHTLAESDRIKKNSVQRFVMKKDKEEKKTQVSLQAALLGPASTMQWAGDTPVISGSSPLEILKSHSGFSYSDTYIVALCCGNKPWTSTSVVPAASLRWRFRPYFTQTSFYSGAPIFET